MQFNRFAALNCTFKHVWEIILTFCLITFYCMFVQMNAVLMSIRHFLKNEIKQTYLYTHTT